jgi:hypothetical protein
MMGPLQCWQERHHGQCQTEQQITHTLLRLDRQLCSSNSSRRQSKQEQQQQQSKPAQQLLTCRSVLLTRTAGCPATFLRTASQQQQSARPPTERLTHALSSSASSRTRAAAAHSPSQVSLALPPP